MPEYKERAPGVYRATFVALDEDYPIVVRETGEETTRWRWVFQDKSDSTTVGELDTITTPGFRARSNALKLFTGMLGRPPKEGDNTDQLIGQDFDVVYGPNQNGRNTVVGATRPTPQAPQNVTSLKPTGPLVDEDDPKPLTASQELAQGREARAHAADIKAAQEGETDAKAEADPLPF